MAEETKQQVISHQSVLPSIEKSIYPARPLYKDEELEKIMPETSEI